MTDQLLVPRELLLSCLAAVSSDNTSNWSSRLKADLMELLAQPSAESRPVAIVCGSAVQWLPGAGKVKDRTELFTHPAPAVVLPEREMYSRYLRGVIPHNRLEVEAYKDGWNACLDEVTKLNNLEKPA